MESVTLNDRNVVVFSRSTKAVNPCHVMCGISKMAQPGGEGMSEMPRAPLSQSVLSRMRRMISPNPSVTIAR